MKLSKIEEKKDDEGKYIRETHFCPQCKREVYKENWCPITKSEDVAIIIDGKPVLEDKVLDGACVVFNSTKYNDFNFTIPTLYDDVNSNIFDYDAETDKTGLLFTAEDLNLQKVEDVLKSSIYTDYGGNRSALYFCSGHCLKKFIKANIK